MSLNKFVALLIGAAVLVVALAAGIIIHWWLAESPVWLSSTSPNQRYTVELTGDKARGGFFIDAVVKYNLLKDGEPIVRNRLAHYGDHLDISFELAYPEHGWIDGNTLRFWANRHQGEFDTLLISNNSDKVIRFLRIKAWDMFFVFNIQPHSKLRLSFTHRSEGKGIWAEGEFEDGSHIEYGVGFLGSKSHQPLGYCMTIDDDRMTISSPREQSYDHRGRWNNLNVSADANCQP